MKLEMQMQVAENIKYLRNVFGYTQTEIADGIHICRSTYALYEVGKKVPGVDTILDLAAFYQVRVDTILQLESEKFVNDVIFSDRCKDQIHLLIDVYHRLSPYSQGCLMERAQTLLEQELMDEIPNFGSEE
mgnify:CR=1 FL=1